MSDPVIESEDIKETQNVEGGKEDERGEGSEGDDEKRWETVKNGEKW